MSNDLDDKDLRIQELEHQLAGLRKRVEKLGGQAVQAEYKLLHLTQEVRRSREAFDFLTDFQHAIGDARSIRDLNETALKTIVAELWMKRAVVLSLSADDGALHPVAHLGYQNADPPRPIRLPVDDEAPFHPALTNGLTETRPWIEAVREALDLPYFVWLPVAADGSVDHVLVAGTLGEDQAQEPRLAEHDLDLMTSVGAILWVGRLNLLARERLQRQVRYQSLLHEVSEVLLRSFDTPASRYDEVIAKVANGWGLDRVRLLERCRDDVGTVPKNQWCSDAVPDCGDVFPLDQMSRWQDTMASGQTITIDSTAALECDGRPLIEAGIRSLLVVPIIVHDAVVGWLSFEQYVDERTWAPEDVQLLEVFTGLIARAVAREREIEERSQLETEYYQSKKMEAVGQLAGGIAHDFNNLLTTIQGYAQLVASRLPPEYREIKGLAEITAASERAANLTRQLLSFSRKDTATSGPLDLNDVVSDTMRLLPRILGKQVSVELDLADSLPVIVGDGQQMSQVVMNLAINARDAMPDGGTVRVTTRQYPASGAIARRFSIPGIRECQLLEVSDTGQGMEDETRERIFEPFFTTKEEGRGTGLGLSIVFSAVRRHGGFIDVQSEIGRGTTFSVFLPVRIPESNEETTEVQDAPRGGRERILIVEDDEGVRAMICEALRAQGYDITSVTNGREALDALRGGLEDVSLIVTDVVMPEMGAREMWREFSASGYEIPVIVMSGYAKREEESRLMDDAAAFLQKPFGPREIARAVRTTLDSAARGEKRGGARSHH